MPDKAKFTKIDGVNYSRKTIPTAKGPMQIEGLTVRALIKSLQQSDPDDLVCYMAEMLPEHRQVDLMIGCIAASGNGGAYGVTFLFGPEGVRGMRNAGMIE